MSIRGNKYIKENNYIKVKCSNKDIYFKISEEDISKCNNYTWRCFNKRKGGSYYIQTEMYINNTRVKVDLHRYLLNCVKGDGNIVDHINGDTLNNQRNNLRLASKGGNQRNSKTQCNSLTGRSGVGFHKASNKYRARIVVDDKEIYLGVFSTFEEACKVREDAENKYFKEYASYEFNKRPT